jgi:hypothetical protein
MASGTLTYREVVQLHQELVDAGKGDMPVLWQSFDISHMQQATGETISPELWAIFAHGVQDQFADEASRNAISLWENWDEDDRAAELKKAREEKMTDETDWEIISESTIINGVRYEYLVTVPYIDGMEDWDTVCFDTQRGAMRIGVMGDRYGIRFVEKDDADTLVAEYRQES